MYLFLILLFMFQLFVIKGLKIKNTYSKITYILLKNTHVVTNTVLKVELFFCAGIQTCVQATYTKT